MDWINSITNILGFGKNFNHFGMKLFGGSAYSTMDRRQKIGLVLSNPAMIKVIALQCDLFAMGRFYAYKNEDEVPSSRTLDFLKNPKGTTKNQFLWDWMFWNMLGNTWCYVRDKNFPTLTKPFILNLLQMEFPYEIEYPQMIFSDKTAEELGNKLIRYYDPSGKTHELPYKDIIHFMDLTSSVTGRVEGLSRLDSLYKIILNSEESLASKKINTEFSRKFLVAGSVDAMDVTKRMLSDPEKKDIEKKVLEDKPVHAVKSMIEIRRFVENLKNMELSKSYIDDYFLIGNMYNIPRDVLEAYQSSTYENQEKARASHVAYSLDSKAEDLCQGFKNFFNDPAEKDIEIVLSWDHLPFVQVMELDRENLKEKKIKNLDALLKLGVDQGEALKYLDLNFKPFEYHGKTEPERGVATEETTQNSGGESGQPRNDSEPENEDTDDDGGEDDK